MYFPMDKRLFIKLPTVIPFYDTYFDTSYAIPTPIPNLAMCLMVGIHKKTPNINLSRFTDLVNVYRDMVLYAHWINE